MTLYAAVEPMTGESLTLYMSHLDGVCFEVFLQQLRVAYPGEEIALVLDGAGAHRNTKIQWPPGISGWELPAYSPELNTAERWSEELRDRLANAIFETIDDLDTALTEAMCPYWELLARLAPLTGYSWWVDSFTRVPTS